MKGDRIENVMWCITHFSIPDSVRVGVLAVGTNNMDADKTLDIAQGMLSCAAKMRELHPHLHVVISAILPRDLHVTARRVKIRTVNELVRSLCLCEPDISFIEESSRWVDSSDRLNEMLYHTDHLHLIKAGNEIFASQLVSAISPIIEGEPKIIKYRVKKRLPLVSYPDTCTYHLKKPPSYPPPPPPISHPCHPRPCTPLSPLPTTPPTTAHSPSSKPPQTHSTSTHSSYNRSLSGKLLSNLYICILIVLLFLIQGGEAGGRGGVNMFSSILFQNNSVFIEGIGGREGIFTGVTCNNSFNKTFVFPHTPEVNIQSGF